MRFATQRRASWWVVTACSLALFGGAAGAEEPTEVRACLERTLPSHTSIQTVEFQVSDNAGEISRSRAKIYWKRFESSLIAVLIRFAEPPRRAGMAMLARQQQDGKPEVYLYLPELRQTRRVSARNAAGSMFGTDFGYEDFAYLQGVASDENPETLDDREIEGRRAYVLQSRVALADEPAYERILYFIERERCTPLRAEFYERGDKLRKVLEVDVDSIEQVGERFVPMRMVMRDLKLESHTAVSVIKIEPDVEIRDSRLEPAALDKGR